MAVNNSCGRYVVLNNNCGVDVAVNNCCGVDVVVNNTVHKNYAKTFEYLFMDVLKLWSNA